MPSKERNKSSETETSSIFPQRDDYHLKEGKSIFQVLMCEISNRRSFSIDTTDYSRTCLVRQNTKWICYWLHLAMKFPKQQLKFPGKMCTYEINSFSYLIWMNARTFKWFESLFSIRIFVIYLYFQKDNQIRQSHRLDNRNKCWVKTKYIKFSTYCRKSKREYQ